MRRRHAAALAALAVLAGLVAAVNAGATAKASQPCGQFQISTKSSPCKPTGVRCPIVSASGVVGISTSVAGGIAATNGAYGGLTLDCTGVADTLTVQAPGHKFGLVHPTTSLDRCAAKDDTITCKLNVPQQRLGLQYVGAWQNAINWRFTPDDPTSHDLKYGSCDVKVIVTLVNGTGGTAYSKPTLTVCQFAAGDVLK